MHNYNRLKSFLLFCKLNLNAQGRLQNLCNHQDIQGVAENFSAPHILFIETHFIFSKLCMTDHFNIAFNQLKVYIPVIILVYIYIQRFLLAYKFVQISTNSEQIVHNTLNAENN